MKVTEVKSLKKYMDLAGELKKALEQKRDGDTSFRWNTWNNLKNREERVGELEVKEMIETIQISQPC